MGQLFVEERERNARLILQMCCMDERDRVQKKTFTKWINSHLQQVRMNIEDLYEDLRDGQALISLLESLSGDCIIREKGRLRVHHVQNIQIALNYLQHQQVKLVNIRKEDIVDGNPKLTLGLIWTIILHYQVSAGQAGGGTPGRERLLAWARLVAKDVPGLSCHNFSSSWRDGRLLCAIVHAHRPGLVDLEEVWRRGARQNLEEALSLAESELGVPRLLDPEDVDVDAPDEKSIITYVSALHNALHKQDGQSRVALDANEDADEFWRLAASLRVWIEERTITLKSRTFPYSIDKLMVMQKEHALMKNSEFPKKKAELLQLEEVYKSMELSNDGHEACRPDELHEAWSGLLNASANYEDAIVSEVQRLEMLQRLAQKMEVDTNTCAEGLNKVYEALQADVALINSGRVPQHGEEISRCLSEIEVFVQSLYPDVRTLTDGGCSQPELLQSRLRRLEEQVASLRAEHAKITAHAGEGARSRSRDEAQLQAASSLQDQTATAYLQELLTWVQSNQATVDKSGYGQDLDETTALLEEQKALHQTIENFRSSLGEAQQTMQSVSQGSRYDYSKSLDKLEQQYSKLLNGSRARLGLLENQQGFLRRCQREMLWLTQREEREVAYDWSDLNPDLEPKKEAYALLVRELEQREPTFREVVQAGEDLVGEGHPGNPTIQAYLLALKTQWSWLLQLCSCVETHLAENTVYFQFFKDARELEQQLRRVQDTVRRRYACDASTPLARLENLLQDAQEEKEQLSELKVGVSKLHKRAKGVVQLKPRRPEFSPRSPTPVTALCSYHQDQVTLSKHDECSLSGVEDGRWTVSNPSGRSGTVPSVCFLVPAPNKEALDTAARVEQRYQDSVSLWKQLYGKMQGLLLWQHLHADMDIVMAWNIDNFRGLAEQDYLSVMDALESHYGQLEGHNEASQAFSAAEMQQLRGDVAACRLRYQQLLEQLVLEERTDEDSEQLLSDLAALSQQLRECHEQLTHGVRAPLDAETAQYVQLCLTAQEGLHREVESLGSEVDRVARKCEPVLSQGVASPRLHALRSQLEQLQHSLQQTHSLSLLYREKLSMLNEVKSSMEETERLLVSYEGRLSEESAIPNETDGIDAYRNTVRQWQTEVSQKRRSMRGLEEALDRALTVGERLSRTHGEACVDLARMRDATQALQGRWDSVDAQVDSRVRDLEKLSRILGHYRQSYQTIMQWVQEVGGQQEEPLPTQMADYQELSSQLNQHKELVTEIDRRQDKVNECQRYSEQYCAALKEYEMQLMEYRALVESAHSGPSRHQWQQSEADTIAQEFLDLRGRYTALVNLTGHRVKTISDSLQQLQQQEETTRKCTGIGGEIVSSDRGEDWGGEETADTCTQVSAGSRAPQAFSDESPSSTQNALPEQDATDSAICLNEDSDDAQIAREAEEDPARDATFSLGSLDGSEALHTERDSHRSGDDDEDDTQGCELESPSVFSREHVDLATVLDQQLEDDEPEDTSKDKEGDPSSQEQQFLDSWRAMHTWLLEISDALSQEPGCDDGIDTLTERLLKLKELEGDLRAHEEAYKACVDLGELAVEAAALMSNHGQLQSMLGELRGTWEKVQALSAEREQSLEASLMLSGQLVDALQALSTWLDGVEPLLSPDLPILGDMDTVARLLREHQALREELSEHGQSAEFVRRASRECAVLGGGNSCGMVERSEALLARWEAVCRLATAKETRLHAALQKAEELARAMTRQLEWCTLADRMLYPHDALPEEEEALQELARQHAEWMLELEGREEEMARISGLADAIVSTCHPDGTNSLKQCLASVHNNFQEVSGRAWRLQAWLDTSLRELEEQAHLAEEMFLWLQEAQDSLAEKETELLPQDEESIQGLIDEHQSLMERMMLKQPEMDRLGRYNRRKLSSESQPSGPLSPFLDKARTRKLSGSQPDSPVSSPLSPGPLSEPRDPHVTALVACWHQVWLAALERQGRLRDALQQSQTMRQEMEQEKFSFTQWRKLFSQQTKLRKSHLMDIFRRLDGDQDGRITRDEFVREISLLGLGSEEWELDAVVGRFGVQEGTLVDYYQFVSELCPSKADGTMTDADKIDDEVIRKVSACKCPRRFQVVQVGEHKYRFGDSQQLRLVRILRSTVMVRVGGGWLSLDDFLQKNDPCRAKGRTNVDLRERLSSGEGGGKAMVLFRSKSGGGKVAAPSRHSSTSSLPSLSACPEDAVPAGGSRDSQQASDAAVNKFRKSGNGKSGRKERIGQLSCSVSSIPSQAPSSGSHKPSEIPPAATAEARPGNNSSSSRVSPTQRRSGTAPAALARRATKMEPSTAPAAEGPNQRASRPLPAKVSKIPTHASHATSRTATSNGPKH